MKKEIRKLYREIKGLYPPFLNTHEQMEFWSEFGKRIFLRFLYKEELKKRQRKLTPQEEHFKAVMKTKEDLEEHGAKVKFV